MKKFLEERTGENLITIIIFPVFLPHAQHWLFRKNKNDGNSIPVVPVSFSQTCFHQLPEDALSFFQTAFHVSNSSSGIPSSISADYKDTVQLCEVFTFSAFRESDVFSSIWTIFTPSFKQWKTPPCKESNPGHRYFSFFLTTATWKKSP